MASHPLEGLLRTRHVSLMITGLRLVYELSPAGSLELGREGGSSGRAMCCGSLVRVRRGGRGELTACVPVLVPILVLVIFPCITTAFCTIAAHVTTTAICQVVHITVSHHGGGRGGGDFGGVGRRRG